MRLSNDTVLCDYTVKLMDLEEKKGLSGGELVYRFSNDVMSGKSPAAAYYITKARAILGLI